VPHRLQFSRKTLTVGNTDADDFAAFARSPTRWLLREDFLIFLPDIAVVTPSVVTASLPNVFGAITPFRSVVIVEVDVSVVVVAAVVPLLLAAESLIATRELDGDSLQSTPFL
jgi:hypothetical protein